MTQISAARKGYPNSIAGDIERFCDEKMQEGFRELLRVIASDAPITYRNGCPMLTDQENDE